MKYKALKVNSFGKRLIQWYLSVKRPLPWRSSRNPYLIWVSEIILQQTRVQQGLPYYHKFVDAFPDLKHLANAKEQDVLKVWEGLGYYSRARNMHKCAKVLMKEYHGKFPESYDELLLLPGIGKYTAGALASFAFMQSVPAIDGNVNRVLTRLLRVKGEPSRREVHKKLFEFIRKVISKKEPDLFNQGMMELGALICKPVNPKCTECPVSDYCEAYRRGDQEKYPSKKPRTEVRKRYFNYVILKTGDKTYLQLRNGNDIWKGLYEFFLVESNDPLDIPDVLSKVPNNLMEDPLVVYESKEFKHLLSHQEIRARFIEIETGLKKFKHNRRGKLYKNGKVKELPKSVLINKYLEARPI